MPDKKRILVTGGAGFIASQISDALIAEGHEVHIIDDLTGGYLENINPAATFHQLDIRTEEAAALFETFQFDVLVHHAAQMDVRKSVADPIFDANVNILGFLNLMEAGRKNGLKKVVFASTGGAIYGEPDYVPQDENHITRPLSPYGITKLVTEKYLYFYQTTHGIPYVALRYGNIYGPRQNPHGEAGVVAIFAQRMMRNEEVFINGDGKQTRDYVYVGDVVKANLAAVEYQGSGVINIGTGVETDVNYLYCKIRDVLGLDLDERHVEAKAGEQRRSVLGNDLAKAELNWTPSVNIDDGLALTVKWFQERAAASAES